jgi:hypothetical protein
VASKPEHSASLVRALKREGYRVRELGGGPRINIPPTLDVVILRIKSVSHGVTDALYKARSDYGLKLIHENGVTAAMTALQEMFPSSDTRKTVRYKFSDWSVSALLLDTVDSLGFFAPGLLYPDLCNRDRFTTRQWAVLDALRKVNRQTIWSTTSKLKKDGVLEGTQVQGAGARPTRDAQVVHRANASVLWAPPLDQYLPNAHVPASAPAPEPASEPTPEPTPEPSAKADGEALAALIRAYLQENDIRTWSAGGLKVELRHTHLGGYNCRESEKGDLTTTVLSEVTCPCCQASNMFKNIESMLSRYSA